MPRRRGAAMTPQTLPDLERTYRTARRAMIERCASAGMTQTDAARELGVSLTCLNNIVRREKIDWPVKRQGRKRKD